MIIGKLEIYVALPETEVDAERTLRAMSEQMFPDDRCRAEMEAACPGALYSGRSWEVMTKPC